MDHRIQRAVQFIEANYSKNISLHDLTKCANLSESHFLYLFKLEMKLSPAKYLKRSRIQKAAELLRSNEPVSIKEAMMSVGITDKSNFTRSFKAVFGVSPREYRAGIKEDQ
ncbi:MAG: hypothetical protein DMF61_25505 [Blastocatellia bacterium AA13]|nr:MAG: hypothetical protein DMF61_25505 [Blastocatellia bacterium AA13]